MNRIIEKAGIQPWEKTFVNLRASRAIELSETYPAHVVFAWMGHTEAVSRKHYLRPTAEHFAKAVAEITDKKATQNPTQQPQEMPRDVSHVKNDEDRKPCECNTLPKDATDCESVMEGGTSPGATLAERLSASPLFLRGLHAALPAIGTPGKRHRP